MHPVVENIRKIIMDKGITQVAASELVGTSASQMSKILNGEVQISIGRFQILQLILEWR